MAHVLGSFDPSSIGLLHSVDIDYYGRRVAAAASDNIVHIYDVGDGQQKHVAQLQGHEAPVWSVSWAHPRFGGLIASSSFDMKVIVWSEMKANQWQITYADSGHAASVNEVKFAPWETGLSLACASSDGTISVHTYSPQERQWRRAVFQAHAAGVLTISWAPVGTSAQLRLASGGSDGLISIWKLDGDAWSLVTSLMPAHSDAVCSVVWRPDDECTIAAGSADKTVTVWKQATEAQPWHLACKKEVSSKAETVSWSMKGGILGVSCSDGETMMLKCGEDDRMEEIGRVNETGLAGSCAAAPKEPLIKTTPEQQAGVQIETIKPGDGQNFPNTGDQMTMHYTGTIAATGKKFDSSLDRGTPFQFKIGLGEVIEGWDIGVSQMSLGQKAVLKIKPEYGYGAEGAGGVIPPNAELNFEVELLRIN